MKFLLILLTFTLGMYAQDGFFYNGKNYGSEALYNPFNLILNGSFDIIQLDGHNRNIFKFPYTTAAKNVFSNLGNPLKAINEVGWGKFISREIFPVEFAKKGAQWWPNYQLHLVGGGMTYAATTEWYEYNKIPYPEVMSIATLTIYHLMNEIVENGSYQGTNADPIADIYVFDIGGIILFSFDNVKSFFKEELNLADWSLQPSFTLRNMSLHNNGQYFSVKWKIPFWQNEKWHIFYLCGMNGLTGLSYKFNKEETFSLGAGLRAKNLFAVDAAGRQLTVQMVWNVGLFYDKNNSLMTSLFFSGLTDYFMNLNIYPGVLKIGRFSPGLWAVLQKNGNVILGISTIYTPGLGFSVN